MMIVSDDHKWWAQVTIVSDDRKLDLYYKYGVAVALALARVVNYALRVMLQIVASLTDDSRAVIYDRNMFIVQATGSNIIKTFYVHYWRIIIIS